MPGKLQTLWPLLMVRELERSLEFYAKHLGFQLVEEALANGRRYWCRLERDGVSLMLQQSEAAEETITPRGRGVTFYFVCDDADALYDELRARQVSVAPPETTYYGMRQVFVPEPDGYPLCFESMVRT